MDTTEYVKPEHFISLDILTSDLKVEIDFEWADNRCELLLSFLKRVAELGHFERLNLSFRNGWNRVTQDDIPLIVNAVIAAIDGNAKLTCFRYARLFISF